MPSSLIMIKKYWQLVGLFSSKYFKKWWVVNLGNVFVMREKFMSIHEADAKRKQNSLKRKK